MDEETRERFEAIEKRLSDLEGREESFPSSGSQKKKAVKEFILEKNPKNDVQRTLCIAFYLEKYENKERFTSRDISEFFKKSKLNSPKNVPDKVQKAIGNGWLEQDNKGEFYVTLSGEKKVEEGFDKDDSKKGN